MYGNTAYTVAICDATSVAMRVAMDSHVYPCVAMDSDVWQWIAIS
jgi:hypothetical protein